MPAPSPRAAADAGAAPLDSARPHTDDFSAIQHHFLKFKKMRRATGPVLTKKAA
jgi:hypothetical protein